jgi:CheY-like chemotaxis protein
LNQIETDKDVLIVEDDEVSIIYLSEILTNEGKTYEVARSGEEAINLIKNNASFKLVLMDIGLPGISGYDTTFQIKQLSPEMIVVAQTAYAFRGDREKCIEAGCDDYLTKPLLKHKVLEIIQKYL